MRWNFKETTFIKWSVLRKKMYRYNPKRSILYPFEQLTVDIPFVIAIIILQYNLHNNNDDTTANNITVLFILPLLINNWCME